MLAIMLVALFADRLGRRRVLVFFALMMSATGLAFALSHNLVVLLLAAFFGTISPSSAENAPFFAIEQAILSQTCSAEQRTEMFARYNLIAQLAGAGEGLAVVIPDILHQSMNMSTTLVVRVMFAGYSLLALSTALLFLNISEKVEMAAPTESSRDSGASFVRVSPRGMPLKISLDCCATGEPIYAGCLCRWIGCTNYPGLVVSPTLWCLVERIGLAILCHKSIGCIVIIGGGLACAADWVAQYDGFYPFAIQYFADAGAIDANFSPGRRLLIVPPTAFTNGCANATGIHYVVS